MTNLHDIKSARETDNLKNDPQIIEIKRIVDWLNDPACSCSLALEDIYILKEITAPEAVMEDSVVNAFAVRIIERLNQVTNAHVRLETATMKATGQEEWRPL